MEPTPTHLAWAGRHAVELYVRTYTTMLQSSGEIRIDALQQAHMGMQSSLHPLASEPRVDMGALIYATRRLPAAVAQSRRVILGQSAGSIRAELGVDILAWHKVEAPARRRRWYHDGKETIAALIASASDVDDLVPTLVAYQLEWNKMHALLQQVPQGGEQAAIGAGDEDWVRLQQAWAFGFEETLNVVRRRPCEMTLRTIGSTDVGYARGAHRWWTPIGSAMSEMSIASAPVYFVSSNLHSLVNVLSGVARRLEGEITDFVRDHDSELHSELAHIEAGEVSASRDNWLYFAARVLFDSHPKKGEFSRLRARFEREGGIRHIKARAGVAESSAQVFKLSDLDPTCFDPRVGKVDPLALKASDAAIVNIDYPLGFASYYLLREVAEQVGHLRGVYVMGKAATLNAAVGDVMICNSVYDEHSGNTYWLENCFTAADVQPHLVYGSALDNQRAVTVRGTFLQNRDYLEFYYQGRYTVVEMEAGPFLDACFEASMPGRHPVRENVNMTRLGFDLGIVHYASDTPYTQARTLGARGLSYRGMDSTYASAVAVARRILSREGALLA
ncbi:MAG TPA: hypothetical protein VNG93_11710 [Candidatus Dormibacteraeota bacterium]|nr:hypothetical protein [Candidatus Dormibacteraeota bacterium]